MTGKLLPEAKIINKAFRLSCSQCHESVHNGHHFSPTRNQWGKTGDGIEFCKLPKLCETCMKKSIEYQVQSLPQPVSGYHIIGCALIYYKEWVEREIDILITGKDAAWFWQHPTAQAVVNAYNDMDIDDPQGYGVGSYNLTVSLL